MDSSAIFNYLSSIHEEIETFIVDEEFILHRNTMKAKFRAHGREDYKRLMHADCLAVEYLLLQKDLVEKPDNIYHDFTIDDAKVDCKIIHNRYFNVPEEKTIYYLENIKRGHLTHFAFYKYYKNPDAPLKVGDEVHFVLKEVTSADTVMKKLQVSQYGNGGYYYTVN